MSKHLLFLIILLAFASCGTIPEIDRTSMQKTPFTSAESREPEEITPQPDEGSQLMESLVPAASLDPEETIPEELVMEEQIEVPDEIPELVPELAEADYPDETPEMDTPPVPAEEPVAQLPPPALVQEPPPAPVQEPSQPVPAPPVVQQEPPPEEPPPSIRQERESPSYVIPDMPFQPPPIIPEPIEANLPYSRTVRAMVGQFIEIPFRGSGWVYLGEFGSRRGVSYDSRRLDTEGMSFIFRADAEGTYSLRFNRHDFVRDTILNDYVKVIIEQRPPATGSSWSNSQIGPERVYAEPRWPLATDPEGRTAGTQQQTGSGAVPAENAAPDVAAATNTTQAGSTQAAAEIASAMDRTSADAVTAATQLEDWLKRAREEYNAGRIKSALDALDQFMILYPAGNDEAFWLYGQSLEANNEATRDIRLSLDYYRRLTREFPLSSRYDEARQRIAYLERFYFNIQ